MREGWSDAIGPVTHVSWRIHLHVRVHESASAEGLLC